MILKTKMMQLSEFAARKDEFNLDLMYVSDSENFLIKKSGIVTSSSTTSSSRVFSDTPNRIIAPYRSIVEIESPQIPIKQEIADSTTSLESVVSAHSSSVRMEPLQSPINKEPLDSSRNVLIHGIDTPHSPVQQEAIDSTRKRKLIVESARNLLK